jgi:hypothetical protein
MFEEVHRALAIVSADSAFGHITRCALLANAARTESAETAARAQLNDDEESAVALVRDAAKQLQRRLKFHRLATDKRDAISSLTQNCEKTIASRYLGMLRRHYVLKAKQYRLFCVDVPKLQRAETEARAKVETTCKGEMVGIFAAVAVINVQADHTDSRKSVAAAECDERRHIENTRLAHDVGESPRAKTPQQVAAAVSARTVHRALSPVARAP